MNLWCVVQIFIFGVVGSISKVKNIIWVEIQYVNSSEHINTIFKHCHACVILENVRSTN